MYERQFGLRENPFAAGHQSKYVYPSREHQEALAHLRFGIENREAFVLITGEVGTGKTTALYDALSEWKSRAVVALITNTALTRSELYEEICMRFGVPIAGPTSKPQLIQQLERHLMVVRARGDYAILLIDEAQNLDSGLLEETRLLSNLEAQGQKLLQIFLVGQPELEHMLEQPELRQLRQRIAVHYRLRPLSPEETEHYIHHRIAVAGGNAHTVFPADACAEVHAATHGIPREINTVAAQALLNAFVEDSPSVRPEHVRAIVHDTGFRSVLDRPQTDASAAASAMQSPPVPMSPPAAVSPVPVSPSHDVPAPTREVRQVPAAAPAAPAPPGSAQPSSIDPEGHTMAGVRPAGSTESWQSWMDSLAKIPAEGAEESAEPAAPEANATESVEPAPAQASAEMSPEEFYAVEEAALRVPIGDEVDEGGESDEDDEGEYDDEVDEEDDDEEYGEQEVTEEPVESVTAAGGETAEPVAAEAGEDPAWLEELTRQSEVPTPRSPAAEAALAESKDFETGPGIQWGDAATRAAEFDEARVAEAMGQQQEPPAHPEPAFMEAARNFAPIVEPPSTPAAPPKPVEAAAAPARPEPAVARVSAAPARPMATAQAMPIRLRERLEAAEREEAVEGGRMTGWLIGLAAVAAVTIGVLFVLRWNSQRKLAATEPAGVAATAPATEASGTTEPTTPPTESTPTVQPPTASTPKSSAPATVAHEPTVTTPSTPSATPIVPAQAVVAPVVQKVTPKPAVMPKPAAPKAQYGVSVASFLAEGRAQSELARLSGATGISGRVVATAEGDYKVVLGSYPDREAAENAAGRLIDSGKVDEARVVPLGSGTKK